MLSLDALPAERRPLAASGRPVSVLDLGFCEYPAVWQLQKLLVADRLEGRREDTLLFVEHPPVFTRGTSARGKAAAALPHPVHDVERGGDITYHGPGQLVGYPILHLAERDLKIGTYLRRLETALIEALSEFGVEGRRVSGLTGVWVEDKKIASIGVAVKGDVSYHGFALNVDCDLAEFRPIRPCGLAPSAMTSLSALVGRQARLGEARERVLAAFLTHF